jgi:hypothetical protein
MLGAMQAKQAEKERELAELKAKAAEVLPTEVWSG